MSGNNGSRNLGERLQQIHQDLDQIRKALCLAPATALPGNNEVARLAVLPREEIRRLTSLECNEAAILLSQEADHIQSFANRRRSIIEWCDECLKAVMAEMGTLPGASLEERRSRAISQSTLAREIVQVRLRAQMEANEVAFTPNHLDKQADFYSRRAYLLTGQKD